ncbi:uracil-DNA glycosylase [Fulvivirga sedimenti]|uniref:Uracil-DNA glycosylase n=1 Tax=Fulvivirga sedimenti TaxID=2879465 RepID=A0A9X1HPP0_9BACT|nr:uracil-DNA glycosylase [Fulvivirga sedimenti]MCA6074856.1 uracil-DNA glycosylase [Fulvivirga sedimenti]MCA6076033.1 uracil-DNA glycosylase [Fulvivirga sedimenti]MCA6077161.1 uracil-DNA glycosylase [Fulvivirga sedimenti]
MDVRIEPSWKEKLNGEFEKPYFLDLVKFVKEEYQQFTIYPPGPKIFNAFAQCPYDQVRIVILGQDPYHGAGQAHGLCFSVPDGIAKPPSLQNIFKEISNDIGIPVSESGNLERWADQGVLLLNATLTVRASSPGSHQNKGWEIFTDAVVRKLSEDKNGLVFLLWGAYAQRKGEIIDTNRHLVLKAAHPSPFAAHKGFFGCRHFSKSNEFLTKNGRSPVLW